MACWAWVLESINFWKERAWSSPRTSRCRVAWHPACAPTALPLSQPSPPSRSTADMSSRSQSPEDFDPTPPELLAELRGTWEVAALSQFYRAFAKAFRFPMGAKFELTEHLERALCDEEQAEALLPHLLGLERKPPDERDAEACWEEVRKLSAKETDGVPLLPEELSPLPDSLGEMAVSQRAALLLALAEAWLAQRSDEAPALRQGAVDGAGGADLLRAERLGADGDGRTYWYMHDLRVYREAPGKPVDAARAQRGKPPAGFSWEVAAGATASEWHALAKTLKNKGGEAGLKAAILSRVEAVEAREAREAREKKKAAARDGPRRISSRQQQLEEARAEQERQEEERRKFEQLQEYVLDMIERLADEELHPPCAAARTSPPPSRPRRPHVPTASHATLCPRARAGTTTWWDA